MADYSGLGSKDTATFLNSGALEDEEEAPVRRKRPSAWDFRGYMQEKKRKLNEQFANMSGEHESAIFSGVTIYVDGFTEPSDADLKKIIHLHGGSYSYKHTSNVTHVIATHLPDVKIKNMPNVVAVTAKWIVDSVEAGQLLATESYRLYSSISRSQTHIPFRPATNMSPDSSHKQLLKNMSPDSSHKQSLHNMSPDSGHKQSMKNMSPDSSHKQSLNNVADSSHKQSLKASDNLVSEFYSHSRLHHLSTWTIELKQYVLNSISGNSCIPSRVPESETLKSQGQSAIVHFDFDCFFASASTRDLPHLRGKPIAITHAKLADKSAMLNSMADIASCNYVAREAGVRNGMHIGKAIQMCPELVAVPYDFETYHSISLQFYDILLAHTHAIEAVSCDEAYVDLANHTTSLKEVADLVESIRKEVKLKTRCDLSAGIGANMLLARMATRTAKPNGQYLVLSEQAESFLSPQKIEHLPGIGYRICRKLNEKGIITCGDLKTFPLSNLRDLLGVKTSQMLYDYSRGEDKRVLQVSSERKSLSAEMNFGIRAKSIADVEAIIKSMCAEVEKRALNAKVKGMLVTLKLKIRSKNSSFNTKKYLGHGPCDNISRSRSLSHSTRSAAELYAACLKTLQIIKPSAQDVRGIGIQIGKLTEDEEEDNKRRKGLNRYLVSDALQVQSMPASNTERCEAIVPHSSNITVCNASTVQASPGHSKSPLSSAAVAAPSNCTTSFSEMKEYLQHWIDKTSPSGPCEEDVSTFAAYCASLLTTNLEGLHMLLQWLRASVKSSGIAAWKVSFNNLLQLINAELATVFGGVFKLELL